jgi:hypothetical protein
MFEHDLRVTIQQIGAAFFAKGSEQEFDEYARTHPAAGTGWNRDLGAGVVAWGIAERVDDYCATAFVYCERAQPVSRVDVAAALADIERRPYEQPLPMERLVGMVSAPNH